MIDDTNNNTNDNFAEPTITDVSLIAAATENTFKVGDTYESFNALKLSVERFAKKHHFEVRYGGRKIYCYRGYQSPHERDRIRYDRNDKQQPGT